MIQNRTARRIMYDWHNGQTCPLYAAASSGLVSSWVALAYSCNGITNDKERRALLLWIMHKQVTQKSSIVACGQSYAVLPWVGTITKD